MNISFTSWTSVATFQNDGKSKIATRATYNFWMVKTLTFFSEITGQIDQMTEFRKNLFRSDGSDELFLDFQNLKFQRFS